MKTLKLTSIVLSLALLGFSARQAFSQNPSETSQDPSEDFVASIMEGDLDAVEALIGEGMDVNMVQNDRMTPLIFAIYGGNLDMVKLLVSKDAGGK